MISDDEIRSRLEAVGEPVSAQKPRVNPRKTGFHSGPTARRGTREFDDLLEEMLEEWDVEEELVDDIVELRRYEDTFEYRLKGKPSFEILTDDDEDDDGDEDVADEEE